MVTLASIDLGSHTARLLVARMGENGLVSEPLNRERAYVYLAKDFDPALKRISAAGRARAVSVLKDFMRVAESRGVTGIAAVATGVIREAANREDFLLELSEKTGVDVTAISGQEEAMLTAKGVIGALDIKTPPFFIFDLGGGTTEIVCRRTGDAAVVTSLPLGAMKLTNAFLKSDPPLDKEIRALEEHVYGLLNEKCPFFEAEGPVIGTGGTVTALYAMHNGIPHHAIVPENINGRVLGRSGIQAALDGMRRLTTAQRIERLGLDSGRAQVMVAGALAVTGLLRHLKAREITVSMSDLLEGVLTDYLEGEQYGY